MRASSLRAALAALMLGLACLLAPAAARADDDELSKLKAELRDTVSSLRDAQDENAALTAKQTELTAQLAEKQHEIDTLKTQQAGAASSGAAVAAAEAATKQVQAQLDQTSAVLQKWQDGYNKAAAIARARDAAARDYAAHYNQAAAQLNQCKGMNDSLEKLGEDMLGKTGRCSVGDFFAAHEPVTQIYRARLETLKESYEAKLRDQKFPPN